MPIWKNTVSSYGLIAKSFHWLVGVLILGMLALGFYMDGLEVSPFKFSLYNLHKSVGTLILILAMLRLSWKFINIAPAHLPSHQQWEVTLAKIVHALLYVVMIAMPLSGWIMSSAGDFRYSFFGLFDMPHIVPKNENIFKWAVTAHACIAYGIIVLAGLHVAGALKHHFIDKDETLQRMTSSKLGFKSGILLTLLVGAVFLTIAGIIYQNEAKEEHEQEAQAASVEIIKDDAAPIIATSPHAWVIDKQNSKIEFSVTQYGTPFTGNFENFDGAIIFNPQDLTASSANITIDIASLKTGSDDRDSDAKKPEWFDTAQFPQAYFKADNFEETDEGYVAFGTLTIRGVTKDIELPFTLSISDAPASKQEAKMDAVLDIDRQAFGIGQGEWKSDGAIGYDVKINIHVTAHRPDLQ